MRNLIIASIAAFAFPMVASAAETPRSDPPTADAPGPYHRNDNGGCQAANGHYVKHEMCGEAAGPYHLNGNACHAANGHVVRRDWCD